VEFYWKLGLTPSCPSQLIIQLKVDKMKNKIPQFLQNKLKKTFALTERFPNEIKSFMIAYAVFYEWNITDDLQLTFRLMKHNISNLGLCEYNGCTKNKYLTKTGVSLGCSKKHTSMISNLRTKGVEWSSHLNTTKAKFKETNLKKFGVDNPMKLEEIKQKGKLTKKEKYGSENYNNLKKMQTTCVERYGDYNPMRIQKFKNKSEETCLAKYGVSNNLKCKTTLEKIKHTNLTKYGAENCFSNFKIRERCKKTMVEKYGVEYPIQNVDIYEKMIKTSFKYKEYKWETGEISLLQGYYSDIFIRMHYAIRLSRFD